jgi:hypothetical protein
MTEQEARERAICKSYDYDDEFYVYLDPDPDNAGRHFVISGTTRDIADVWLDDDAIIACYSAGAIVS